MKKYLLLFFLTSILQVVKSQNSFPVFTDNSKWSVYGIDNFWTYIWKTKIYQYEKDTVMCGYTYSKLIGHSNFNCIWDTINYIRTTGEKTYIKPNSNCSDKEYLLYDFSLSVGDTVYCGYNCGDTTAFWVTGITTVNYFGINRKKISVNSYIGTPPWGTIVGLDWIEGIGSPTHPFYPTVCLSDACETAYTLLCYDSAGIQLYQNQNYSSCYITGIEEETENINNFSIYPNPFTNIITLKIMSEKFEIKNWELKIYNTLGQTFYYKILNSNFESLNLNLKSGIYFIQITNSLGNVLKTGKLIKQ